MTTKPLDTRSTWNRSRSQTAKSRAASIWNSCRMARYTRPEFWLSAGWETVKAAGWQAPLYWQRDASDETRLASLHAEGLDWDCPRYSMCRCATSAFSKPMPLHAGEVADSQRKRNGNASRANRRLRRKSSRYREAASRNCELRASSNSSGTVGNGRPALTPAIRDTSPSLGRWANTTASLCPARWFCAEGPASHPRIMCGRPIATSFNRRLGGSSLAYVWRSKEFQSA